MLCGGATLCAVAASADELEVAQLRAMAEQAAAPPLQDGLTIPAAIAKARAEIEARTHARYAAELAEHQEKHGVLI